MPDSPTPQVFDSDAYVVGVVVARIVPLVHEDERETYVVPVAEWDTAVE